MKFDLGQLNSIQIGLASKDVIINWSHAEKVKPGSGEVTKPETINYRSQKPEPDGLFCERIFGPSKDYECHCGKYKKIRFNGQVCEKCGVEVTTKAVRRERMGYIRLASPCSHIWYVKGTPSKMALLLNVPAKQLEEVIYFQSHIVLNPGTCKLLTLKEVLDEQEGRQKFKEILTSFLNDKIIPDARLDDIARCKDFINHLDIQSEPFDFISISKMINRYTGAKFGWGAEAAKELLSNIDIAKEFDEIEKELKETSGENQKREKLLKRLEVVESIKNSNNQASWMVLDVVPVIPPDLRPMLQLDGGRYATSDLNDLYRRVITRNSRLKKLVDMRAPTVILVNEKRMLQEAVDALIDNGRRIKPVTGVNGRPLKSLSSALKGKQGRFRQNLLGKRVDYSGRSVICVGPFLKLDQCGLPREMAIQLFRPFIICELLKNHDATTTKQADNMINRYDDKVYDALEKVVPNHPVLLNRAPTLHRLGIEAFRPVLVDGRAIRLHPLVCPGFNADFDGDQMPIHVPLSKEAQQEAYDLMISTKNILSPRDATVLAIPVQDIVVGHFFLTSEQTPADFIQQRDEYRKRAQWAQAKSDEYRKGTTDEDKIQADALHSEACSDEETADDFETFSHLDGHFFRNFDEVMRAYQTHSIHMNNRIVIPFASLHKSAYDHVDDPELNTAALNKRYLITTVGKLIFNNMFPQDFPYVNDAPSHFKDIFKKPNPAWFLPKNTDVHEYLAKSWTPTQPFSKKELSKVINELFRRYKSRLTSILLDRIKDTGYFYCTKLGLTISITDINLVPGRDQIISAADKKVDEITSQYDDGLLTDEQRHEAIIKEYTDAKDQMTKKVQQFMLDNPRNPVFMMASSGARGSVNNFVQLIGMRGLMSGPNNTTLEIPVKDSFRQGMTVSEYFIATHGARKGSTDTALKTADSGYLTRRLVDVSHSVVIRQEDCGVDHGVRVTNILNNEGKEIVTLAQRCLGRFSANDIVDPDTGELICPGNTFIDESIAAKIGASNLKSVEIRTLLTCQSPEGVCIHCYGRNMATGEMAKIGDTVGILAAQSIGEPGTQLTMRTFHEGGTAGSDITMGLPRVQELLEVRNPKGAANISEIDGEVTDIEPAGEARYNITIKNDKEEKTVLTNYNAKIKVTKGQKVLAGDPLTFGSIDPKELLKVSDPWKVAKYLIDEVQKVYCSQSINISDKHIEVIVKEMLGKILVIDGGDTNLIPGIKTDVLTFTQTNQKALEHGQRPAVGRPMILGVTKAALDTSSFLSSASFQETTKVLTDAALKGKVDYLKGLKENVMIGKLIPAGTTVSPLPPDEDFVGKERESEADFKAVQSNFSDTEFFPDEIAGYSYNEEPAKTIDANGVEEVAPAAKPEANDDREPLDSENPAPVAEAAQVNDEKPADDKDAK